MSATEPGEQAPRGRLFVVTGSPGGTRLEVARALADRLGECILVDADVLEAMVVGRPAVRPSSSDLLRLRLLRWSACIAIAETYQLDGVDAVVTDELLDESVEAFLDLAAPEPVHLVVVDDGAMGSTPHWGLWLASAVSDAETAADIILERLSDSLVATA